MVWMEVVSYENMSVNFPNVSAMLSRWQPSLNLWVFYLCAGKFCFGNHICGYTWIICIISWNIIKIGPIRSKTTTKFGNEKATNFGLWNPNRSRPPNLAAKKRPTKAFDLTLGQSKNQSPHYTTGLLWSESTADRWFPSQRTGDVESVSMLWRHRVLTLSLTVYWWVITMTS